MARIGPHDWSARRSPALRWLSAWVLPAFAFLFSATAGAQDCPPSGSGATVCDYWDVQACAWLTPACPEYTALNIETCQCDLYCPSPLYAGPGNCYLWDTSSCEWISLEAQRPEGCYTWNPGNCTWEATVPMCTGNSHWDPQACACVCVDPPSYPNDGNCYLWDGMNCAWVNHTMGTCTGNYQWNESCDCICVQPPYPQDGYCYRWDQQNCSWYNLSYYGCGCGFLLADGCLCLCTPPPYPTDGACYTWDEANCLWVAHSPACNSPYQIDENCNCVCVPPPAPEDGLCYEWSGAYCLWVLKETACPEGQVFYDCACQAACAPQACQEHFRWSEPDCGCIQDCSTPLYQGPGGGFYWDASACEWLILCGGNNQYDPMTGRCLCPENPNNGPLCWTLDPGLCQWMPPSVACDYGYYLAGDCQNCLRDCGVAVPPEAPDPCYHWDLQACNWAPPLRPEGTCLQLNADCAWVHMDTACPPNSLWSEDFCICLPCDQNITHQPCDVWDPLTCTYNAPDTNCPAGQKWNETSCQCETCQPTLPEPACSTWDQATCQYLPKDTHCAATEKCVSLGR